MSLFCRRRGGSAAESPVPRWRRWTVRTLRALVLLEILYVISANLSLRTGWVEGRINRRPDRFHIAWGSATTWIPGRFRLSDVTVIGQGTRDIYYGSVRDCSFSVRWGWLFGREIECRRFQAWGVDFRLSQSFDPARDDAERHKLFPPVPGLDQLPRRTGPRAKSARGEWKIVLSDIDLKDITQIWLKEVRIRGVSSLRGALTQQPDGNFWTRVDPYLLRPGSIAIGGENSFTNLNLELAGTLGPVVFDDVPDDALYGFISANLKGAGEIRDVALLRPSLNDRSGIRLGGIGRFQTEVLVRQGLYSPGSRVSVESDRMSLNIHDLVWEGKARLEESIGTEDQQPTARLRCNLENLSFRKGTNASHSLVGTEIAIESDARDLRMISAFADATLGVHISPMTVPDPSALNEFIPAAMATSFRSGTIVAMAELDRDSSQKLRGTIALDCRGLGARSGGQDYQVDLRLSTQFRSDASRSNRFELMETSLDCTNLWVSGLPRGGQQGWHARLVLDSAAVTTAPERVVQGQLRYELQDTRPILALIRTQPDAPGWLGIVPSIRDVQGTLSLATSTNSVSLRDIDLRARGAELRGSLEVDQSGPTGLLYIRWRLVSFAMDLRNGERRWKLLAAKRWFDRISAGQPPFSGDR